jgi:hypothetical protein
MRSDTRSITIDARPKDVVAFLADPRNLPRWAIGFAKHIRQDGDRWFASTSQGEIGVAIDVDDQSGTVDFRMEVAPGVEAVAYSRVLPNREGAEYVFTQFQQPGVPDELFGQLVTAVRHELVTLKAHLEVSCPL